MSCTCSGVSVARLSFTEPRSAEAETNVRYNQCFLDFGTNKHRCTRLHCSRASEQRVDLSDCRFRRPSVLASPGVAAGVSKRGLLEGSDAENHAVLCW